MFKLLIRLAVWPPPSLLVTWALQQFAPPDWQVVRIESWSTALIFAIVLGLLNALVRPVLLLVTCPLNFITFGLFMIVINAVVFGLAARLSEAGTRSWG